MAYNPYHGYGQSLSYPEPKGKDGGLYYPDNQQVPHAFNYNSHNGFNNHYGNSYSGISNEYTSYTIRKVESIEKELKVQQVQKEQKDNMQEYTGMPYWHRIKRNTPANSGRRLSRHVKPNFKQLDLTNVTNSLSGDENHSSYQLGNSKMIPFESPLSTSHNPVSDSLKPGSDSLKSIPDSSDFMEGVRNKERESIKGEKGRIEHRMMSEKTKHELDKREQVEIMQEERGRISTISTRSHESEFRKPDSTTKIESPGLIASNRDEAGRSKLSAKRESSFHSKKITKSTTNKDHERASKSAKDKSRLEQARKEQNEKQKQQRLVIQQKKLEKEKREKGKINNEIEKIQKDEISVIERNNEQETSVIEISENRKDMKVSVTKEDRKEQGTAIKKDQKEECADDGKTIKEINSDRKPVMENRLNQLTHPLCFYRNRRRQAHLDQLHLRL